MIKVILEVGTEKREFKRCFKKLKTSRVYTLKNILKKTKFEKIRLESNYGHYIYFDVNEYSLSLIGDINYLLTKDRFVNKILL